MLSDRLGETYTPCMLCTVRSDILNLQQYLLHTTQYLALLLLLWRGICCSLKKATGMFYNCTRNNKPTSNISTRSIYFLPYYSKKVVRCCCLPYYHHIDYTIVWSRHKCWFYLFLRRKLPSLRCTTAVICCLDIIMDTVCILIMLVGVV